jgi:hypothetical protein
MLLLAACGTPTEPESRGLPVGWWIGDTDLQVRATDAIVYLACGAATFPQPSLDRAGNFEASGKIKISVGPPPPPPMDSPGAPANFIGRVTGSTLTLTITSTTLTHTWTFHYDGTSPRTEPPTVCP